MWVWCYGIYCTFKLSSFRSLFCWFGHLIPWCWTCVWNPRTCRHPSSQDNSVSSALEGFLQSCCTPGMKPLTDWINDEMCLYQIGSMQWFNKASSIYLNFKQSCYFLCTSLYTRGDKYWSPILTKTLGHLSENFRRLLLNKTLFYY